MEPKKEAKEKRTYRKANFEMWTSEEGLAKIREYGKKGLSILQMSENIGISPNTLYKWAEKSPEFKEALKDSRETADANVENALYNSALSGNVTAMIFWLKCRKKGEWTEKGQESNEKVNIEIKL